MNRELFMVLIIIKFISHFHASIINYSKLNSGHFANLSEVVETNSSIILNYLALSMPLINFDELIYKDLNDSEKQLVKTILDNTNTNWSLILKNLI